MFGIILNSYLSSMLGHKFHDDVGKTKALISCTVTVQLICVFVFAYAESHISYDVAHI